MPALPTFGGTELIVILVLALMIFGAGKLPTVARDFGRSFRELRDSLTGDDEK